MLLQHSWEGRKGSCGWLPGRSHERALLFATCNWNGSGDEWCIVYLTEVESVSLWCFGCPMDRTMWHKLWCATPFNPCLLQWLGVCLPHHHHHLQVFFSNSFLSTQSTSLVFLPSRVEKLSGTSMYASRAFLPSSSGARLNKSMEISFLECVAIIKMQK